MRIFQLWIAVPTLLLLTSRVSATPAAALCALSATAQSSLQVLGDSTIHKWEANALGLEISAILLSGTATVWEGVQKGLLRGLSLSVQVDGLKSNENVKMDRNMRKALDSNKFSNIQFVMENYELKAGEVLARGVLTIHGTRKEVELTGKILAVDKGVAVKGSYDLLMSDYGVKPPVMMLGTVRVRDKVSIVYDFVLVPKP